ncbi:MAG: C39 family peptidase [Anaerolineae bacterium]|jgi:hypothetical protein
MAIQEEQFREYQIEPEHAARHAAAHMHVNIFTNTPGMTTWRGANLGESTLIYDLNGRPLFYDFPVLSPQREQVGTIRASASRVLGVPAPTTYLGGPRWNTSRVTLWSQKYVESELRGRVIDSRPVCYAYPKLGIAVDWEDPKGEAQRTIIDVGDYSVVPERVEPQMRGPGAVSVYDSIPEKAVPEATERFALYDKMVQELQERAGLDLASFLELEEFHKVQTSLVEVIPWYTTKILTFCTHDYSHECFWLHPQETGYNCVPATGQMILDFWRYYNQQSDVATAMNTRPTGTGWADEVNGLESLTCSHFDAQDDRSPTFDKVRTEIDANRPFDYSYSYHAMACAGYRQANVVALGTTPEQSVYIYDPSPVNIGTIRWETWGSGISPVDGFVYLRRP